MKTYSNEIRYLIIVNKILWDKNYFSEKSILLRIKLIWNHDQSLMAAVYVGDPEINRKALGSAKESKVIWIKLY